MQHDLHGEIAVLLPLSVRHGRVLVVSFPAPCYRLPGLAVKKYSRLGFAIRLLLTGVQGLNTDLTATSTAAEARGVGSHIETQGVRGRGLLGYVRHERGR